MPTAIAGKLGRTILGGVTCSNDRWKVTYHAVDIPTTNFESSANTVVNGVNYNPNNVTAEEGITGPYGGDGEVSGYYDIDFPPFNNPPNLQPGVYGPVGTVTGVVGTLAMILYTRKAGNALPAFTFPSVRIQQSVVDVDVNGRVNFAVSFKNNKAFLIPTV